MEHAWKQYLANSVCSVVVWGVLQVSPVFSVLDHQPRGQSSAVTQVHWPHSVFPLESKKTTYTYILNKNFGIAHC